MPARFASLLGVVLLMVAFATTALADGGPSPGVLTGGTGVVVPSGTIRYVVLPTGGNSAVAGVSTHDGRVLRYTTMVGKWGIPLVAFDGSAGGLSVDGRTLVLGQLSGGGVAQSSRFILIDPMRMRVRREVTLRGDFSFDALSPDARTLYVIEHTSQRDLTRYTVRALDLRTNKLSRAIVDKREHEWEMSGQPVTRAATRDGRWVYTLYRKDGSHPFIHALDATHRQAICIDLPWRGSQAGVWELRLRIAADRLLVARRGSVVARIDRSTHRLVPIR